MQAVARPTGVTILATLSFIFGTGDLLSWLSMLVGGTKIGLLGAPHPDVVGGVFLWWLVRAVSGVLNLVFAYGAWTQKSWAWALGVAIQVLGIVVAILYARSPYSLTGLAMNILYYVIILYFLFRPQVRSMFYKV